MFREIARFQVIYGERKAQRTGNTQTLSATGVFWICLFEPHTHTMGKIHSLGILDVAHWRFRTFANLSFWFCRYARCHMVTLILRNRIRTLRFDGPPPLFLPRFPGQIRISIGYIIWYLADRARPNAGILHKVFFGSSLFCLRVAIWFPMAVVVESLLVKTPPRPPKSAQQKNAPFLPKVQVPP